MFADWHGACFAIGIGNTVWQSPTKKREIIMKTQASLISASILALGMGFAGSAYAIPTSTCGGSSTNATVTGSNSPEANLTVDSGGALILDCGLGIGTNDNSTNVDGLGGVADWDFYDRDDGNGLNQPGFSVTGADGSITGTWEIDADEFDAGTQFLIVLKDGPATSANNPKWVWFFIDDFTGTSDGDWRMYGNKANSHISLYTTQGGGGDDEIPEPGVLFLMGAGLLGLGMARRRKAA